MSWNSRTKEEAEHYIESLMLPGETIEASHIAMSYPLDVAVVTSHRYICTTATSGGGPLRLQSVPFDRIAAVSVINKRGEKQLDGGTVEALIVTVAGKAEDPGIKASDEGETLLSVYRALVGKVCDLPSKRSP